MVGGRFSHHDPLCGPILIVPTRTKLSSTSNAQSPPPSTCLCTETTACLSVIRSSGLSPTLLDDSDPYPSRRRQKTYIPSPLAYLAPLPSSRNCRYGVIVDVCHVTPRSRTRSSMETSLRCAGCVWNPFAPSYLGGTWSTSRRSYWPTRYREKSLSDNFSTSSKAHLTFAKSNSTPQPRPLAVKTDGWYHWRV